MIWDPNQHPREAHGLFTSVLRGMRVGSEHAFPDGIRVRAVASTRGQGGRTQRKFRVISPSEDTGAAIKNLVAGVSIVDKTHSSAERAARDALDRSARMVNPKALGGKTRYQSYDHFKQNLEARPQKGKRRKLTAA